MVKRDRYEETTTVETMTERALGDGHLRLETVGKTEKIHYVAVSRAERWSDPEEKVRAEFYAELIYQYGYAPRRIGVEVTVPDRSPSDFADLVVFHRQFFIAKNFSPAKS